MNGVSVNNPKENDDWLENSDSAQITLWAILYCLDQYSVDFADRGCSLARAHVGDTLVRDNLIVEIERHLNPQTNLDCPENRLQWQSTLEFLLDHKNNDPADKEQEAIKLLTDFGIVNEKGHLRASDSIYKSMTNDHWTAVNYLCNEWDYCFLSTENLMVETK